MAARIVQPLVRLGSSKSHARLLTTAVRLPWISVGVFHHRHCITVRIAGRHSPDERGLLTWDYTLSSRPEVHSVEVFYEASAQCCLWNHFTSDDHWVISTPCPEKSVYSIVGITSSVRPLLVDFQNSFTTAIFWKFTVKLSLNIPPCLKHVATLPCEKLMSENYVITEIHQTITSFRLANNPNEHV